jgi:hypothetical protein
MCLVVTRPLGCLLDEDAGEISPPTFRNRFCVLVRGSSMAPRTAATSPDALALTSQGGQAKTTGERKRVTAEAQEEPSPGCDR